MKLVTFFAALLISVTAIAQESPAPPPLLCVDQTCTSSPVSTGYEFPAGSTAPSVATLSAVPTFHNVSLYWSEPTGSGSNEALVRFRQVGTGNWRQGLSLWFDARKAGTGAGQVPYGFQEYRGSLVQLESNTTYEVEVLTAGSRKLASTLVTTWNETLPVGTTVTLPTSSNSTLNINQSGTPNGYRLYTFAPGGSATIDGKNSVDNLVVISGSYVILRGVTLKNARHAGILLARSAHHVVIEDNDIFNFGTEDPNDPGFACNGTAGISTENKLWPTNQAVQQLVIQNNRIHHPNFDANSWEEQRTAGTTCGPAGTGLHPAGADAILLKDTGGNHVIRYNEIYSDFSHMFKDGLGGGQNFSHNGDLRRDSDVYGNKVSHVWDDAIQVEGANRNVRVYGNYIEQSMVAIAAAPVSIGPLYVFRNVATKGIRSADKLSGYGWFWKTRNKSVDKTIAGINMGGGRTYIFHNTLYRTSTSDSINQMLSIDELSLVNVIARNNIINAKSQISSKFVPMPDSSFDRDLFTSGHSNWALEEKQGIEANPVYDATHTSGKYTLKQGSPGHDAGIVLPNFSDKFSGAAPDMGAQENGAPAMRFGRRKL